jgi:hypothetical protein
MRRYAELGTILKLFRPRNTEVPIKGKNEVGIQFFGQHEPRSIGEINRQIRVLFEKYSTDILTAVQQADQSM